MSCVCLLAALAKSLCCCALRHPQCFDAPVAGYLYARGISTYFQEQGERQPSTMIEENEVTCSRSLRWSVWGNRSVRIGSVIQQREDDGAWKSHQKLAVVFHSVGNLRKETSFPNSRTLGCILVRLLQRKGIPIPIFNFIHYSSNCHHLD